jgi:anti-anti-sigma factor
VTAPDGPDIAYRDGVLRLRGDLDLASAADLTAAGTAAVDAVEDVLQVDTSEVSFADSTTLGALISLHHHAGTSAKRLVFGPTSDVVRRLLAITGLDAVLTLA